MEIQNILTLIQAFTEHSLTELHVEDGGVKVCLKREPGTGVCTNEPAAIIASERAPHTDNTVAAASAVQEPSILGKGDGTFSAPAVKVPDLDTGGIPAASADISSEKIIASPLVGIFYSASSPEAESFVKVGDRVKKGQVLGIIEAMKLMNEIESEYDGVVEAILVNNEDVVEYGQPLFRIR